jgi:hypothetical protein
VSVPKPFAAPDLVAALTSAAPRPHDANLDAEPRKAVGWDWSAGDEGVWTAVAPGGDVVTLRAEGGRVRSVDDVRCSCLLSPRCLHALAAVIHLGVAKEAAEESAASARAGLAGDMVDGGPVAPLAPEQIDAVRLAWRAGAEALAMGASSSGAVVQAELLRAVHACRASGLHRAARAGLRVVQSVRDLRAERPEFELASLAASLFDLLDTTRALAGEAVADPARIGTARRTYEPVGNLRLRGLFAEPVIAPGYAGVVTYLADGEGRVWALSDVMPGEEVRAVAAYEAPAALGDASLPHRELCREGLFVQSATGSADGRLGAGSAVKAVRACASRWSETATLWDEPLAAQVRRAFVEVGAPGLLFARGEIVGADGDALVVTLESAGAPAGARFVAPTSHESLAYRDNLRLLARAPGLRLDVVARVLTDRPRTAALLAVGGAEPDAVRLPGAWAGRCNLGLDRLARSLLPSAEHEPVRVRLDDRPDPLVALRRRILRLAIGGRATLPPSTLAAVEREAALLERRMMPRGAATLRALAAAACAAERDASGARRTGDSGALAEAWLAAFRYERAAARVLWLASWGS